MSRTTIVVTTDDITGEEGAQTVSFAFDGVAYVIDLGTENYGKLTAALAPFIANAQRAGRTTTFSHRQTVNKRQGRNDPTFVATVKSWARENGIHVPARGRVPDAVYAAYRTQAG